MHYKGYLRACPDTKKGHLKAHKYKNRKGGGALRGVGAHNALHCFFPIIFFMHVGKVDAYYSYVSAFVFGYFLFSVSSFYYFLIPFLGCV